MGSVLSLMTGHVRRIAVTATVCKNMVELRPELNVQTLLVTVMCCCSSHLFNLQQESLQYLLYAGQHSFFIWHVSVCCQTPLGMLLTISANLIIC